MKVLFVHTDYYLGADGFQKEANYAEGLASLSAVLKQEGHGVSLYHILSPVQKDEFVDRLREEHAGVIGFSSRTRFFPNLKPYLAWAREASPSAFILCGGYHASLAPDEVIEVPDLDAICVGEAEYPMMELCEKLERGEDITSIDNLWLRTEKGIVRNPVRPLIEDLDSLPFPDFDLFDYPNLSSSRINTALIMVSRGCPYSCTYCCNHQLRKLYPNRNCYNRFRSPRGAVDYINHLREKHPFIKYINFMDNILGLDRQWLKEFCALYSSEVDLPFSCRLRANLVDEEIVDELKKAGCYLTFQGVESGNQWMLNKILRRGISIEQIERSFDMLHKAGIGTLAYNIVGLPHEDLSRVLETIKLNARIKPSRISTSIFYPYPGTDLHKISYDAGYIDAGSDYYEEDVPLKQPQFSRRQVMFSLRYFNTFVGLFKFAGRLPGPFKGFMEKVLEKVFCSRLLPLRLLNAAAAARDFLVYWIKKTVSRFAPFLYTALRNLKGGYRIKKVKKV